MIKNRLLLIGILFTGYLFAPLSLSSQSDFNTFWKKFKDAVVNNDKTTVANLAKFPLSMPYGLKSIQTKAELLDDYDNILNREANAKRCFQATKPLQEGKGYAIYCTFKKLPESSENRPIRYYFAMTKTGWKFVGIDNINE